MIYVLPSPPCSSVRTVSLSQHYSIPVMVEMLISVLSSAVATSYMCLLSTCSVASATEKLSFSFYLILMSLNLNSHP